MNAFQAVIWLKDWQTIYGLENVRGLGGMR